MTRRIPLFATAVVMLAVAIMIGLGIWQLQRMAWKNALLASYAQASRQPAMAWPVVPDMTNLPLFRRASAMCVAVVDWRSASGRNRAGAAGWVHIASCRTGGGEGPGMQAVMGWSQRPDNPAWNGGLVRGIIAPDTKHGIRLVADVAAPGLEPAQTPNIDEIPNNHFAYAVQWFLFAASALVIYGLALYWRSKPSDAAPPAGGSG